MTKAMGNGRTKQTALIYHIPPSDGQRACMPGAPDSRGEGPSESSPPSFRLAGGGRQN